MTNAITQDVAGHLWVGTTAGLAQFDGVRFEIVDRLGGTPLPERHVLSLLVARDGSLWIGFAGASGVSRFSRAGLVNYNSLDGPAARVSSIVEDQGGAIWIADQYGVAVFRDGTWRRLGDEDGLRRESAYALYVDRRGTIWVGAAGGVFKRTDGDTRFQRLPLGPEYTFGFVETNDGRILATDPRHGFGLIEAGKPWRSRPSDFPGLRILRDRRGRVWVTSRSRGVLRTDFLDGADAIASHVLSAGADLSSAMAPAIYEDRDGNVWIGTAAGLDRYSEKHVETMGRAEGIRNDVVRGVAATSDGSMWVATDGGIVRFIDGRSVWYDGSNGLTDTRVNSLHVDAQGVLWASTARGIARFEGQRFVPVPLPEGTRLGHVHVINHDSSNFLWLGDSEEGVFRLSDGKLTAVTNLGDSTPPSSSHTDRHGTLWFGYESGGVSAHREGRSVHYGAEAGLPKDRVVGFFERSAAELWILHTSRLTIRSEDGRFEAVALPVGDLSGVVADAHGALWFGTGIGIVRIDPGQIDQQRGDPAHSIQYSVYDESDGLELPPISSQERAVVRAPDGRLWFTTARGIAVIDPERFSPLQPNVSTRILRLSAAGRTFESSSGIELPPLTSSVQIDYAGVNLSAPSRISFRYRLEGFDAEWVNVGSHRQAFYAHLRPGTYRFQVVARTDVGPWTTPAELAFTVVPAFYQTGTFLVLCATCGLLVVGGAWRIRAAQFQKHSVLLLSERARMAREVHDTVLQSMAGAAMRCAVLVKQVAADPEAASVELGNMRRRLEHDLREARYSINDLRSPMLDVSGLSGALKALCEDVAREHQIRCEFNQTGQLPKCSDVTERELLRIAQEAVRNAIDHGQPHTIRVELNALPDDVQMRVSDDGVGFDAGTSGAQRDAHFGIRSMRERAQRAGGTMKITSAAGRGALVEVTIASPYGLPTVSYP